MYLHKFFAFIALFLITGCSKIVQVSPPTTELVSSTVFKNNGTAAAALTSIYDNMMGGAGLASGQSSLSTLMGLYSDEMINYGSVNLVLAQFYTNELNSSNIYFWNEPFQYIYAANAALENLPSSNMLDSAVKSQLLGEARYIRAFMNFYLTNLYGDIPIVTTTNYQTNNTIKRSSSTVAYTQIIADLTDAELHLSPIFVDADAKTATNERVRPTKWAAAALLARTYLYNGDYDSAAIQATMVINSGVFNLDSLNGVFQKNSGEAIWQLQPVQPGYNTYDGYYFIIPSTGPNYLQSTGLATSLINSFEQGDLRFVDWVDSVVFGGQTYYFPFKYKNGTYDPTQPVTEYVMVLRLAEQYLIRAECEANGVGGGLSAAVNDLNIIRLRAGLLPYSGAMSSSAVLASVIHERQVEFFSEWGHRWFDIKRLNLADSIMSYVAPQKGGTWSSFKQLLPIPHNEILINQNLQQNPGYQ